MTIKMTLIFALALAGFSSNTGCRASDLGNASQSPPSSGSGSSPVLQQGSPSSTFKSLQTSTGLFNGDALLSDCKVTHSIALPSIEKRDQIRLSGSIRLIVAAPSLQESPAIIAGDWKEFAREFHAEMSKAYSDCLQSEDCNGGKWELSGVCSVSKVGQVFRSVCEFTSFHGDARSFFTTYRTANYIECAKQLRQIHLVRDICRRKPSCPGEIISVIAMKVMLRDERMEFERMVERDPESLNLFTIDEKGFIFWFGERARITPRTWESSSEDGKNTIRVPFSLLENVLPRYRDIIKTVHVGNSED